MKRAGKGIQPRWVGVDTVWHNGLDPLELYTQSNIWPLYANTRSGISKVNMVLFTPFEQLE